MDYWNIVFYLLVWKIRQNIPFKRYETLVINDLQIHDRFSNYESFADHTFSNICSINYRIEMKFIPNSIITKSYLNINHPPFKDFLFSIAVKFLETKGDLNIYFLEYRLRWNGRHNCLPLNFSLIKHRLL